MLDIHHLAYGRGNSTFVLCPDGTTMLIDAGTTADSVEVSAEQKPNSNIRPGEWIAAYALRHMAAAGRQELDYFLLTHMHPIIWEIWDLKTRYRNREAIGLPE